MPPDVLLRKLTYLRGLLTDLFAFQNASFEEVLAAHYQLERLFELLVMTATDILFHALAAQGVMPDSYRSAFKLAGDCDLLPAPLAARLQRAAGMRNIIVHLYQDIDYTILHANIQPALDDFGEFLAIFEARLPAP